MNSLAKAIDKKELEVSHLLQERPENEDEVIEKHQEEVDILQKEVNLLEGRKKRKITEN